jgi:hypothetical protein
MDTTKAASQGEFAALVGTSQATVSRMIRDGLLERRDTLGGWIAGYVRALEAEKEALAGDDDSAEARASRLALTRSTTRLRDQQTRALTRETEARIEAFVQRVVGEVRALLFQRIPTGVVGRLLNIIPEQKDRYAAADAFREVIIEACATIDAGFDERGFLAKVDTSDAAMQ